MWIILRLFHLGILSCTVFVLICTVVVLYCFVICGYLCVCVSFVMCVCRFLMCGVWVIYLLYSDWGSSYPDWGFSVLFPQLQGKCQGKTRKYGARSAIFQLVVICVVLLLFVFFYVLFVCKCVLDYCHRVKTQLQLTNIYIYIYIWAYFLEIKPYDNQRIFTPRLGMTFNIYFS